MSVDSTKEAISFLQKTNSIAGGTVYDHLAAVVGKLLEDRPNGPVDLRESSLLVKKTEYVPEDTHVVPPVRQNPLKTASAKEIIELYRTPEPPINATTGEPEEVIPPNEYEVDNVLAHAAMFSAVGIGFGTTEWYHIMLSMKRLGEDPVKKLQSIRFFGKFYATSADYYVFECIPKTFPDPVPDPTDPTVMPQEAPGVGTNACQYYVCTRLGGPVVLLPDVHPTHIVQARALKRLLTGDLKAEVSKLPRFDGCEENYLRAQIARISAGTKLCPNGYYNPPEGEEEGRIVLEKAEDFEAPDPASLAEKENWAHMVQHIKVQGRCVWWAPPEPEEPEEDAPEPEEPEESPPIMTTIDQDVPLPNFNAKKPGAEEEEDEENGPGYAAWSLVQSSALRGEVPGSPAGQVVCMRSNLWPGAITCVSGTSFGNIYVGFGVKYSRFLPPPPPPVKSEYQPPVPEDIDEEDPAAKELLVEAQELPPPPPPPGEEGEEGQEEED